MVKPWFSCQRPKPLICESQRTCSSMTALPTKMMWVKSLKFHLACSRAPGVPNLRQSLFRRIGECTRHSPLTANSSSSWRKRRSYRDDSGYSSSRSRLRLVSRRSTTKTSICGGRCRKSSRRSGKILRKKSALRYTSILIPCMSSSVFPWKSSSKEKTLKLPEYLQLKTLMSMSSMCLHSN